MTVANFGRTSCKNCPGTHQDQKQDASKLHLEHTIEMAMVGSRMSSPGSDQLQEHQHLGNVIVTIVTAMAVIRDVSKVVITVAIKVVRQLHGLNKDGTTMAADMEELVALLEPVEVLHHGNNRLPQEAMDMVTTPAATAIKGPTQRLPLDYHGSNSHTHPHLLVTFLRHLLLQVPRLRLRLGMGMVTTIIHRLPHRLRNDFSLRTSTMKASVMQQDSDQNLGVQGLGHWRLAN